MSDAISIVSLGVLGFLFLASAYLAYGKDWKLGAYFALFVGAIFLLVAVPPTRGFLRTTAWAAFVTALESTGQGLVRLSRTIDDIRERMKAEQAQLDAVQAETQSMQNALRSAQQELEQQQVKLTDLDSLLKAFYEARKTELFSTAVDYEKVAAIEHDENYVTIYLLLEAAPIPQTVDLQWHVFAQPKNSYFTDSNVVVFRWAQSLGSFRTKQLTVTYVPDPKRPRSYGKLTTNGRRVFADSDPLMYGYPDRDPIISKLLQESSRGSFTVEQFRAAAAAEATDSR